MQLTFLTFYRFVMELMHVAMHDIKKTWQFANMCNCVGSQMQSCEWSMYYLTV